MIHSSPSSVLIVDDSRDNTDIVRRFLELRGFRAVVAHDAQSALAAFDAERPAVVLLDVRMPGRSGLDVCRDIRRHEHGARARVIMLTGLVDTATRTAVTEAGADDLIAKPVDLNLLERCVRAQLELLAQT